MKADSMIEIQNISYAYEGEEEGKARAGYP